MSIKKLCSCCGQYKTNIRKDLCRKCSYKNDIKNIPLIKCQCSDICQEMILSINTKGKLVTIKRGHYRKQFKEYRIRHYKYYEIYKPHYRHSYKNNGRVLEHRYIYYIYLSILNNKITYIPKGFDIHHKNKNTFDNRIENLELITKSEHQSHHNPRKDRTNTFCNLCKTNKTKTYLFKNKYYDDWRNDINGFLCKDCYNSIRQFRKKFGLPTSGYMNGA